MTGPDETVSGDLPLHKSAEEGGEQIGHVRDFVGRDGSLYGARARRGSSNSASNKQRITSHVVDQPYCACVEHHGGSCRQELAEIGRSVIIS